jgi:hypothetical protein
LLTLLEVQRGSVVGDDAFTDLPKNPKKNITNKLIESHREEYEMPENFIPQSPSNENKNVEMHSSHRSSSV